MTALRARGRRGQLSPQTLGASMRVMGPVSSALSTSPVPVIAGYSDSPGRRVLQSGQTACADPPRDARSLSRRRDIDPGCSRREPGYVRLYELRSGKLGIMDRNDEAVELPWPSGHGVEVDPFGVPLSTFGGPPPPEFFEILGRIVSVHARIEYLRDRIEHLPLSETSGVRKVEQFIARCSSGRTERNAVVHSLWVIGAKTTDPNAILGVRYKTRKLTSGTVANMAIADVPGSEREQDIVEYTLDSLRALLKQSITTMRIGEQAYSEIMLTWAAQQTTHRDANIGFSNLSEVYEP